MTNEQALAIIKTVLDQASKAGLFENMDSSFMASNAFNKISSELIKQNEAHGS
jgi:hypothetical protein